MSDAGRLHDLFSKYLARECSEDELNELVRLMASLPEAEKDQVSEPFRELWMKAREGRLRSTADNVDWNRMYDRITAAQSDIASRVPESSTPSWSRTPASPVRRIPWRWVAAAVFFALLGTFALLFSTNHHRELATKAPAVPLRLPEDVKPGINTAILTLGNGSNIVLDSAGTGELARQGGTKIIKRSDGQLAYQAEAGNETVYNIVSTPRAAQYQITLPDGTGVWLNAASTLRFPTNFSGKERRVELTGEAYFEVARDKDKPFLVKVAKATAAGGDMDVQVLGTHFDIMAYGDEANIQTTLLEGSVAVRHGDDKKLVEPGSQARLARKEETLAVEPANTKQAVAWKNGLFYFDKSNVPAILRQVSRWYDLDIVYESPAPDMMFSGKIERSLPLSGIAALLKSGQLHFRIEGKKFIVMN